MDLIIQIAGVIGGLIAIGAGGLKVYKIAHRLDLAFGADKNGLTPSARVEAQLAHLTATVAEVQKSVGPDKDGRGLSERMGRVEYQLHPNGGGSMSDRVGRIEVAVAEAGAKSETALELLGNILDAATLDARTNQLGDPALAPETDTRPSDPTTKTRR